MVIQVLHPHNSHGNQFNLTSLFQNCPVAHYSCAGINPQDNPFLFFRQHRTILSIFADSKSKNLTSTHKKLFSYSLKIAIVVFAFWFIYEKLSTNNDLKEFMLMMQNIPQAEIIGVLTFVCLLMLLNWGLEAVKWKRLVASIENLSLWRAIESVFCGLTWAIFTPNRLGEYGGRVFFLSPKRRIIGVIAMAVGNIGQLVLTNVFGSIAVCLFVYRFKLLQP